MDTEAALRGVEIFTALTGRQIARLAKRVHRGEFPAGTAIMRRGDNGVALYVILSGRVAVSLPSGEGAGEQRLGELGPGQVFGEIALLDGGPRSADIIAVEPTQCILLSRWDFEEAMRRDAQIARALLPVLCARIAGCKNRCCSMKPGRPPTDTMAVSEWIETPLLDGLAPEERRRLTAVFTRRSYPAGAEVIRQGETCERFYVIESGSVVASSAERGPLSSRGPGECLGEVSMLTGGPASATVTALTDVVLHEASHTEMRPLLEDVPVLARNFCRLLGQRLAAISQRAQRGVVILLEAREPAARLGLALSLAASLGHHLQQEVALLDFSRSARSADGGGGPDFERPLERLTVVRAGGLAPDQIAPLADTLAHRYRYVLAWAPGLPQGPEPAEPRPAWADRMLVIVGYGSAHRLRLRAEDPRPELIVLGAPEPRSVAMREALERETGLTVAVLLPEVPAAAQSAESALDWAGRRTDAPFARGLDRLARRLIGKTVGLAFGAGAGRGHAHMGVLRALERLGIRADFVAGTSIGAVVGGMYAYNLPVQEMEMGIRGVGASIRRSALPIYSLMDGAALDRALRQAIPPEIKIEDLPLPSAGVAADLRTGEAVMLCRGSAWQMLRACIGIPGVFPPMRLEGRLLVDGGVVSPVPCGAARALGADVVIGISLEIAGPDSEAVDGRDRTKGWGPYDRRLPTWPVALLRALDLLQQGLTQQCLQQADVPIRVFAPSVGLTDFRGGPEFLAAGERAVQTARGALGALLPWVSA